MPKEPSDKADDPVLDAARRRALKVGLASVPLMLTLKSKPAFAGDPCGPSMSMSAAQSHGVLGQPGCTLRDFTKHR